MTGPFLLTLLTPRDVANKMTPSIVEEQYMLRTFIVLAGIVAMSPVAIAAPAATFIIQQQEVTESVPELDAGTLRGKRLWLGDRDGDAGSAKFIQKGRDEDEVLLNEESRSDVLLGYDQKASFLPVHAERLDNTAVAVAISMQLSGWPDTSRLVVYKAAELDLNGDGKTELIVKANSPRDADDPYRGDGRAIEGLFILNKTGTRFTIEGKILAERGSEKEPRTNIDLLAIGRNPSTNSWDLLVRAESRQWGPGNLNISVAVNGNTTTSSDDQALSYETQIDVYRFANGSLTPSSVIRNESWSTCFGASCE